MSVKRFARRSTRGLGRIVGDEMSDKLASDVFGRCRVCRQPQQNVAALRKSFIAIIAINHMLWSRLMQVAVKEELSPALRILPDRYDAPPRNDLGEVGDVVLRIAGAHAQGMKLENFTSQIFVEAFTAALPGYRIRPNRAGVVEIK